MERGLALSFLRFFCVVLLCVVLLRVVLRREGMFEESRPVSSCDFFCLCCRESCLQQSFVQGGEVSIVLKPGWLRREGGLFVLFAGGFVPSSLAHPCQDAVGLSVAEVAADADCVDADLFCQARDHGTKVFTRAIAVVFSDGRGRATSLTSLCCFSGLSRLHRRRCALSCAKRREWRARSQAAVRSRRAPAGRSVRLRATDRRRCLCDSFL